MLQEPGEKYKVISILSVAALLFVAGCVYVYNFFIDDTLISLRFARNLVDYGELSFNPGDAPVEGYTNFLLVLLEALFIKVGVENVLNIPKIIGILSGLVALVVTYKISAGVIPERAGWVKFVPVIAVAVSSTLATWAVGGLETDLYLLFLLCGMYFFISGLESNALRDVLYSDLFFMLAFLTRPDAILLWGLSYVFLVLFYRKVAWRNRIYSIIMSAVLMSIYLTWKYFYFGSLLPTTFYSKVESLTPSKLMLGLTIYSYFIKSNLNYLYLFLFIPALWAVRKQVFSGITYLLLLYIGFSAYVIYLGNPVMAQAFRFHVPLIPILYVVGAYGLWNIFRLDTLKNFKFKTALVGALCAIQVAAGAYQLHYYRDVDFGWNDGGEILSISELMELTLNYNLPSWISETFPPNTVVAAGDVGAIGYYSNAKIIDTWSLMDKRIIDLRREQQKYPRGSEQYMAIERQQIAKYILDQNPALILLDYVDYSADPRSEKYIRIDIGEDDKHLFVREDLLIEPPSPEDLRLSEFRADYQTSF